MPAPSVNPQSIAIFDMGDRTATQTSAPQALTQKGIDLIIDVETAPGGGQTLTPVLLAPTKYGKWREILRGTPITDTGLKVYGAFPGATPDPGYVVNTFVPDVWVVVLEHSGAGLWRYSACVDRHYY